MAFVRRGRGGRRIVFVHGLAGAAEVWGAQFRGLSSGFELVAVDLLGHGASSAVDARTALAKSAGTLARLIDSLPPKPTILVAHSLGGHVVARMPKRRRGVVGTVFVDSPCLVDRKAVRIYSDFGASIARKPDPADFIKGWFGRFLTERATPDTRRLVIDPAARFEPGWIVTLLRHLRTHAELPRDRPVAIIEGAQYFEPGTRLSWHRNFPKAPSWRYAGSGHFYFLEDPRPFNAALRRLIVDLKEPRR